MSKQETGFCHLFPFTDEELADKSKKVYYSLCGEKRSRKKIKKGIQAVSDGTPVCGYCADIMRKELNTTNKAIGKLVDAHNVMVHNGARTGEMMNHAAQAHNRAANAEEDFREIIEQLESDIGRSGNDFQHE